MGSIQLALSDAVKADALRVLLARSTPVPVLCADSPDFEEACVVVMDTGSFNAQPLPLARPDRMVLITSNDPAHLQAAWDAGVHSVLSEQDSLSTVVLAVLATCLRSGAARQQPTSGGSVTL